jgi:prepilin-type N-terminal cleavage/methylation domain-containing protein
MRRRGFTLIELLTVIGIVAVLLGLLIPAVLRVRESGNRSVCLNNLKQTALALQQYHDQHGVLPPGHSFRNDIDPLAHTGWTTRILPFVEQTQLWLQTLAAFEDAPNFLDPPHYALTATVIPTFLCPSDGRVQQPQTREPFIITFTSFVGNSGRDQSSYDGVLFQDSAVRLSDITDGTSTTLLLGERPPSADLVYGWWYAGWGQDKDGSAEMILGVRERPVAPAFTGCAVGQFRAGRFSDQCAALHYWSPHPGGALFATCAGAVQFLNYRVDPLLPALASRNRGEPLGDWLE